MKNRMNHFYKIRLIAVLVICFCAFQVQAQSDPIPQTDRSVVGKVITGYQGWFNFTNDGTPLNWRHWFGTSPNPHGTTFEVYPDISEYAESDLAAIPETRQLGPLGDGRVAKLFSSYKEGVIDTHVKWMQEYEIDGLALQRFMSYTTDNRRGPSDTIAVRLARAAVKYDRIFYIMWDMGASNTDVERLKTDWTHLVNDLKLTDYSSYAHQDGKPVVCIWGVGLDSRTDNPDNWLEMINWLKSEGCYVIGGVPRGWRTLNAGSHSNAKYTDVYKALDMVSPWWVGVIRMNSIANHENERLKPDLAYCQANGMEFQPVIFPGFAWSQWKQGSNNAVNDFPRLEGRFAWEQFKRINNAGIKNLYLAMFDEYDEGTNWMKSATDFTEIPTGQYFLTTSADGYWLSSDFQLRVAKQISLVTKGKETATSDLTVPHSLGPVYYRNSFEKRESELSRGIFNLDPCFYSNTQVSIKDVTGQSTAIEETELAKSGLYAARIKGTAGAANANYYYRFSATKIIVTAGMELSFAKYAVNDPGRYTTVSLAFSDGTYLHNLSLKDKNGVDVSPKNPRGTIGAWTEHTTAIGTSELVGKTITGILLAYEGDAAGSFDAYFDNILIEDKSGISSIPVTPLNAENGVWIYPENGRLNISAKAGQAIRTIDVYDTYGRLIASERNLNATSYALPLSSARIKGQLILVKVQTSKGLSVQKVIF